MNIESFTISWSYWLLALLLIVVLYTLLTLLRNVLERVNLLGSKQSPILSFLKVMLPLYEPAAILFLLVGFIFINPMLHGLLVAFIFLLTFSFVKDYIHGRLFLLSHSLQKGERISTQNHSGLVRNIGRLGISLQVPEGVRFISYSSLMTNGFMLLKGEKIARLHQLLIKTKDEEQALPKVATIENYLFSCPYIDWGLRPEIHPDKERQGMVAQVLVRKNEHLQFLISVIEEWGFSCSVIG